MKTTDEPIVVEQKFSVSVESLWKAVTEIEQMKKWYFDNIPDFKAEVGFKTQFNVQNDERNFLHMWKVTEVEPLRLVKYNWEFKGYQGKSSSAFHIIKENDLVKLRLTIEVLEDFQDDVPEFARESCIEGWRYFINGRLMDFFKSQKEL